MKIGERGVFVGYSGPSLNAPPVFSPGAVVSVCRVYAEGIYRCRAISLSGQELTNITDMVLAEEIVPLKAAGDEPRKAPKVELALEATATPESVDRILALPGSKHFNDLRDRAAYVHVVGGHPSHLRTFFTQALVLLSDITNGPTALDGRSGVLKMKACAVERLRLNQHPMVLKAREYVSDGWLIRASRGPNERRPYTKVFLLRGAERVAVQIDGSVLTDWP
ncbi:MAG: hypothetical protein K2X61_10675 [Caulobacteraceae bacterium]|nr:hypothetical protein [Caulobacteraceae bacterium]